MEEERVVYKKKGSFIGRLLAFLLAFILGIIAGIGGLVGAGYFVTKKKTVKELFGYAKADYSAFVGEDYAQKTVWDAIGSAFTTLKGFSGGTTTFNDLNAISPLIGDFMQTFVDSAKSAYGIDLNNSGNFMDVPVTQLNEHISNCIQNTPMSDLLGAMGTGNKVVTALCYGVEGEDYYIDENNQIQMYDGKKALTVGEFAGEGLTTRLSSLPVDTLIDVKTTDATMCALAYGPNHRYTITENEQGASEVQMNQAYYDFDGTAFIDDNGETVSATSTPIAETEDYILSFEDGTKQYLQKPQTRSVENRYLVYKAVETETGVEKGEKILFKKTTVGQLENDSASVINNISLKDALGVTHTSHKVMIALAYGEADTDYTYEKDTEGNIIGIQCENPRTLGDLRTNGKTLIDDISLTNVMTPNADNNITMYILYGKKNMHYQVNGDGAIVPLQKKVAIGADGKVYNEYGEEITYATATGSGTVWTNYTQTDADGNVLAEYSLDKNGFVTDEKTKTLVNGEELDLYHVYENSEKVMCKATQLKDLSGDSKLLSNFTARLTLGDVMKNADGNKILAHLKDSTIDNLPTAANNLTVGDVFDDDMHFKNEHGEYTNKDGVVVANKQDALKPTWKYLIRTQNPDGSDSTIYHYDYKITSEMSAMVENIEMNMQNTPINTMHTDGVLQTSETLRTTVVNETVRALIIAKVDPNFPTSYTTVGQFTIKQLTVYVDVLMNVAKYEEMADLS